MTSATDWRVVVPREEKVLYIERLQVQSFRHIIDAEFGPFRHPQGVAELIVLAGPNGGGKSSVLELLSYGLTSRYSWQYYQSRNITDHSFAIKIGLTDQEIDLLAEDTDDATVLDYARETRGYWMQVNLPTAIEPAAAHVNEQLHALVSQRFRNFSKKLGFFIRSDRGYAARHYDRQQLFNWKRRLEPQYFNNLSYVDTSQQFADMYDFLVEQSYHHIYNLGLWHRNRERGVSVPEPDDPLEPYNELLNQLFPGYSFEEVSDDSFVLRVKLPTGDIVPFQDLSSGEKEVFFLLSFFIRNNVEDSVTVIDEPELHLHPELARKLVRLMRTIRPGNQIWCATHSAELIDEAGRERTFFLKAREDRSSSECRPATADGAEIQILRDMFGYSGYVGLSQKVVFSEGTQSSADRKTFTNLFPQLTKDVRLIPAGSVNNLYRINEAILALLQSDFARCEFYLIRDRDYLSGESAERHRAQLADRLFILSRYHIENYLLDDEAIADVMRSVFHREVTQREVREQLYQIAHSNSAAFLRDLVVFRFSDLFQLEDCRIGNHSSQMSVQDAQGDVRDEVIGPLKGALLDRIIAINGAISGRTSAQTVEQVFDNCLQEVREALRGEGWRRLFPGRYMLERFSAANGLGDWPALQNLLIERLSKGDIPVDQELEAIFRTIGS